MLTNKALKDETLRMRNKTRNHKDRSKSNKQRKTSIGFGNGSKTSIEELLKKTPKRSNYVNNYEDYKMFVKKL